MKIYELTEENIRTKDFGNPLRVLDDAVLEILADATMLPNEEDKEAVIKLAVDSVGGDFMALSGFCQGFDLALQYMELMRRKDDLGEFEKSLGISED